MAFGVCRKDHASQHDAKVVDNWLATQDFGRDEMFPPNSPDLNLIENVWGMMVQGMAADSIETLDDLTRSIQRQWEAISPTVLQRMWFDYKLRLQAVINANGDYSDY